MINCTLLEDLKIHVSKFDPSISLLLFLTVNVHVLTNELSGKVILYSENVRMAWSIKEEKNILKLVKVRMLV